MKKAPVGVIRVLTTDNSRLLGMHGTLIMEYFPGLEAHSACIPNQPEGIHDETTEAEAVPKVLDLARNMERGGMKAVIISCAGDPAVEAAAKELRVPVIGAGRAVAAMARVLDRPVGVLGITPPPQAVLDVLGSLFAGGLIPQGVASTLDLLRPEGMEATLEAGRALQRQGAKALALACTGMSTIGAASALRGALGIPVIDPVRAEAAAAWAAIG